MKKETLLTTILVLLTLPWPQVSGYGSRRNVNVSISFSPSWEVNSIKYTVTGLNSTICIEVENLNIVDLMENETGKIVINYRIELSHLKQVFLKNKEVMYLTKPLNETVNGEITIPLPPVNRKSSVYVKYYIPNYEEMKVKELGFEGISEEEVLFCLEGFFINVTVEVLMEKEADLLTHGEVVGFSQSNISAVDLRYLINVLMNPPTVTEVASTGKVSQAERIRFVLGLILAVSMILLIGTIIFLSLRRKSL